MTLHADLFEIGHVVNGGDKVFIVCNRDGVKHWQCIGSNEELKTEKYLLGVDSEEQVPLDDIVTVLPFKGSTTAKVETRKTTAYHTFLKHKTQEYATLYPQSSKKERFNKIVAEWKQQNAC